MDNPRVLKVICDERELLQRLSELADQGDRILAEVLIYRREQESSEDLPN